ncbi:MAG: hypothetical protein IKQ56_04150 [Lachnospiraceae bacterium]|nr:hypothetical protein [Lachnospiraceae bacterium]
MQNPKKNLLVFIGFLVVAGLFHIAEHTIHDISALGDPHYAAVTMFFCLELIIYTVLILSWIQSVYTRLLPSISRNYMVIVAVFMIFHLVLRAYKYRIAGTDAGLRLAWYAYYIPMTFIPAMFLLICIRIRRGAKNERPDERLLLIIPTALSAVFMTNDLHHLVFVPEPGLTNFIGKSGTYTYRITFYLAYSWMILAIAAGLFLLIRTFGLRNKKQLLYLAGILLMWLILMQLHTLKKYIEFTPPYESPEINIFTLLAIFEFAIRHRLIPCNENYAGFFAGLPMTIVITDTGFRPVYRSAGSDILEKNDLIKALETPIYPSPDHKLSGKKIRGGYTFWIEDESRIHQANEDLNEANEILESENTLIEYENRQKEENAYLRLHHHIYHEIAQEMYPCQQKIAELLNEAHPQTDGFKDIIAEVSVLNAFVKRKTNMLLMASEHDTIPVNELMLSISESGKYLAFMGIKTSVDESGFINSKSIELPSETVISLYDTFRLITELLYGHASMLMVAFKESVLTLATDSNIPINTENMPLPTTVESQDDILYISIQPTSPDRLAHVLANDQLQEKGGEQI